MKKQTTALLLGSLLATTGSIIESNQEKTNQLAKIELSDLQCQDLGNSIFENFQNKNFTPIVDRTLIKKHILGSPNEYRQVLDLLLEVHSIPEVAYNINLVFTHLRGFRIVIYPAKKLQEMSHAYAKYFATSRTMCLPDKITEDEKFFYKNAIMHEFNHAAMQAMLEKNSNATINSTKCYFPISEDEETAMLIKLQHGDANIEILKELLKFEAQLDLARNSGKPIAITPAVVEFTNLVKKLKEVRNEAQLKYEEHYQISFEKIMSNKEIEEHPKLKNKKFEVGKIINLDIFDLDIDSQNRIKLDVNVSLMSNTQGKLKIKKIVDNADGNSKTVTFIFWDPLHAIAYQVPIDKAHVEKDYSPEEYLCERIAYLEPFPPNITRYLYEGLYKSLGNLLNTAFNFPSTYQKPLFLDYVDLIELETIEVLEILRSPESFVASYADSFIRWARYVTKEKGKVEEAKIGLNTLIQRGYHVGEANLELGRIAFSEKDYKAAEIYYKRAHKYAIPFSSEDADNYSFALDKMGKLKSALKWFKKASCPREDFFESEENMEFSTFNMTK